MGWDVGHIGPTARSATARTVVDPPPGHRRGCDCRYCDAWYDAHERVARETGGPPASTESAPAVPSASKHQDPPETTLDDQPHVGCVPNWTPCYDYAEQLRRFGLTTDADLLMGYGMLPASRVDAMFSREDIERAKDYSLSLLDPPRTLPGERVLGGVDPASASGPRASWFVATAVKFVPQPGRPALRVLLGQTREKGIDQIEDQGAVVQQLHRDFGCERIAIECNQAQKVLATFCSRTLGINVMEIFTGAAELHDATSGIPALSREFGSNLWRIPWKDEQTRRRLSPLVNELLEYPQGTRDCIMTLLFARAAYYDTPQKKPWNPQVGAVYA